MSRLTPAAVCRQLRYAIETRYRGLENWEIMAAFDVKSVATDYANDCRRKNGGLRAYRVRLIEEPTP